MRFLVLILVLSLPYTAQLQVEIISPCDSLVFPTDTGQCEASLLIEVEAETYCVVSMDIIDYKFSVDFGADGQNDLFGNASFVDTYFPTGFHSIEFIATDLCFNKDTCVVVVLVEDRTSPQVFCQDIAIQIQANEETAPISASMLRDSFFDNCGPFGDDHYLLQQVDANDQPLSNVEIEFTLACSDLGVNYMRLWIYDEPYTYDNNGEISIQGNGDYCIALVHVADPNSYCGIAPPPFKLMIQPMLASGQDFIHDICPVVKTNVCSHNYDCLPANSIYANACMIDSDSFDIILDSPEHSSNGISTWDIVLIRKHILNVNPFTQDHEYIAADVNGDNKVSTFDIVLIRKLILGIDDEFPTGRSWRFMQPSTAFDIDDFHNGTLPLDSFRLGPTGPGGIVLEPLAVQVGNIDMN